MTSQIIGRLTEAYKDFSKGAACPKRMYLGPVAFQQATTELPLLPELFQGLSLHPRYVHDCVLIEDPTLQPEEIRCEA